MVGLELAINMVFKWETFMWLAIGVAMGVAGGALPGLTAATSMALFLPLAFKMPTGEALGLLIGIYKGAVFGGSIAATATGGRQTSQTPLSLPAATDLGTTGGRADAQEASR